MVCWILTFTYKIRRGYFAEMLFPTCIIIVLSSSCDSCEFDGHIIVPSSCYLNTTDAHALRSIMRAIIIMWLV